MRTNDGGSDRDGKTESGRGPRRVPGDHEAPRNYHELLTEHFDFIRTIVRRAGVREDEDAAQEILVRFWELGMLDQYDSSRTVEMEGRAPVRTRFRSFLGRFASLHALHHRDSMVRDDARRTEWEGEDGTPRAEAGREDPEIERLEEEAWRVAVVGEARRRAEDASGVTSEEVRTTLGLEHARGAGRIVARTFVACEEVALRGPVTRRAVGEILGVSDTSAGTFLRELRDAIDPATLEAVRPSLEEVGAR